MYDPIFFPDPILIDFRERQARARHYALCGVPVSSTPKWSWTRFVRRLGGKTGSAQAVPSAEVTDDDNQAFRPRTRRPEMNTDTTTAPQNVPPGRNELVARWHVRDGRLVRTFQRVNPPQVETPLAA